MTISISVLTVGPFSIDFGPGVAALGGGILGEIAGFAVGGIAGAISGGDQKYDLSQEPSEEKIRILRDLRRMNK